MSKWLLRGLVFAALMVIVRLLQGAMINAWETRATTISISLVSVYAIIAFIWGFFDGRADLAMTWLLAGLFAGVISGLVTWLIGMFYKNLYVEALVSEVTTFAAFTALLVFLLAILGVAIGRWLVDRKTPDQPRQREDDERADTDVFAAVRPGGSEESRTAEDYDPQTGPVATQTATDRPDQRA